MRKALHAGFIGPCLGMAMIMSFTPVMAQENAADPNAKPVQKENNDVADTARKAGDIATQPARDIGVDKSTIPEVLLRASEDPYSVGGIKNCRQINAAIAELNEILGPDFSSSSTKKENRAGKIAEAGGKTVVNALIPFRGLVREISGAAPAERRLNIAISAGYARRGFLRGVQQSRKCRR